MSGTSKIPFFGIDRQYKNIREEILAATDEVYKSGQVLDGPFTLLFEQTIAKMTERKHAVSVNSGTQALIFALRAIDNHPIKKSKVLIPAVSFVATLNAVIEAGFDPVFCDVDPETGLIDLNKIPVDVNDLSAVMYVNLYGNIIDYDKLTAYRAMWDRYGVPVIEDAAQSFGAYYRGLPSGKLGDVSCLSFDPTKNLNNYGSGGMVLTDDIDMARDIYDFKDNGKANEHVATGTNSKMSESDCAQMLVKLRHFDQWQERRRLIAEYYTDRLDGVVRMPAVEPHVEHSWHKFAIHVPNREVFKNKMEMLGIETRTHYWKPLHLENASFIYSIDFNLGVLEAAEEFCKTTVSLPIYPELSDAEVEHVVDSVLNCIGY